MTCKYNYKSISLRNKTMEKLEKLSVSIVQDKKLSNAKMINLIGSQIEPYRQNIKLKDNEFFFDYLKKEIKDKRKMGHVTTLIK